MENFRAEITPIFKEALAGYYKVPTDNITLLDPSLDDRRGGVYSNRYGVKDAAGETFSGGIVSYYYDTETTTFNVQWNHRPE